MIEVYVSFLIYWFSLLALVSYAIRKPKEVDSDEERI